VSRGPIKQHPIETQTSRLTCIRNLTYCCRQFPEASRYAQGSSAIHASTKTHNMRHPPVLAAHNRGLLACCNQAASPSQGSAQHSTTPLPLIMHTLHNKHMCPIADRHSPMAGGIHQTCRWSASDSLWLGQQQLRGLANWDSNTCLSQVGNSTGEVRVPGSDQAREQIRHQIPYHSAISNACPDRCPFPKPHACQKQEDRSLRANAPAT